MSNPFKKAADTLSKLKSIVAGPYKDAINIAVVVLTEHGAEMKGGKYDVSLFPERTKQVLESRGLTQSWLSVECGIGETLISKYLNGVHTPGLHTVARIAEALEVSIDYLCGK